MRISPSYQEFLAQWPNPERYLQRHMRFLQTYHANFVTGDPPNPDAVIADYREVWTDERVAQLHQRTQGVDLAALVADGYEKAATLLAPAEDPEVILYAGLYASNASQYLIDGHPVIGVGVEVWGGVIPEFPCPWSDLPMAIAHEFGHVVRYAEGDCQLARAARPDYLLPRAWTEAPLLEFLIDEGLAQAVSAAAFPELDEMQVLMFTADQLQWFQANFDRLWREISAQLDQPPGFQGFKRYFTLRAEGLPPRTGYYIGWRLVRDFLARNPQVSLATAVRMPAAAFLP